MSEKHVYLQIAKKDETLGPSHCKIHQQQRWLCPLLPSRHGLPTSSPESSVSGPFRFTQPASFELLFAGSHQTKFCALWKDVPIQEGIRVLGLDCQCAASSAIRRYHGGRTSPYLHSNQFILLQSYGYVVGLVDTEEY